MKGKVEQLIKRIQTLEAQVKHLISKDQKKVSARGKK